MSRGSRLHSNAASFTFKVRCGTAHRRPAYGWLVWIEGECDWELNRRAGQDYDLQPPKAVIDPSEDKVSIEATYAIRDSFSGSKLEAGVRSFFDALIEHFRRRKRMSRNHKLNRIGMNGRANVRVEWMPGAALLRCAMNTDVE